MRVRHHSLLGLFIVGFGCASLSLGGCGRYVSSEDYIDNSMSSDLSRPGDRDDLYGYVPPYDRTVAAEPVPEPRYHLPPVVVIPGGVHSARSPFDSPRENAQYASDVREELNSLGRELMRIQSRANQKGAAGRAAIEPAMRDFNMATQEIARNPDHLDNMSAADLDQLRIKTDLVLDRARQAVRDAAAAVDAVRSNES